MGKSIKVVFIKQNPDEDFGYVFLRTIEGKTTRKKSLKIKLSEFDWKKYFNPKIQRFRDDKRFPNSDTYNSTIDTFLEELHDVKNELSFIGNDKKSFLDYWEFCLKNTKNHGTVIKHRVVITKLKKFLLSKKRTILYFKEITPIFLRELKHYLETSKDPKSLSKNSVNHYLKIIKSIINKSVTDEYYTYVKNPFNSISFKRDEIVKKVLNEDELSSLIKTKLKTQELNNTRDVFLFQLISFGMRISDILLLRWGNLSTSDTRLNYTMFKTGTPISLPINLNMCIIISKRLGIQDRYQKINENLTINFTSSYQKTSPFGKNVMLKYTMKMFDQLINPRVVKNEGITSRNISSSSHKYGTGISGKSTVSISHQEKTTKIINYKGFNVWEDDTEIKRVIDKREELISSVNLMFIESVMGRINKTPSNDFIFPLLSKKLFDKNKISDNRNPTIEQYKNIKHSTIVYNRKLKKLQQECKITTNLSSHVPRHSFTNILLNTKGVNLYDISQSLGHKNLKTTENYVKSGFNVEKIDYLSKEISLKFNLTD